MNDIHSLHILLYSQAGNRQRDIIRIKALDEKIQAVAKDTPIDEHFLKPCEDFTLYQVSLRNSLVINLCQSEIRDVVNSTASNFRKRIITVYMIACIAVAFMSVSFVMKQHAVSLSLWVVTMTLITKGVYDARRFDRFAFDKAQKVEQKYLQQFFKTRQIELVKDACAICFEEFEGGLVKGHLAGGKTAHVFHTKCLDQMIEKVKNKASKFFVECPLCKDPIVPGSFEMKHSA